MFFYPSVFICRAKKEPVYLKAGITVLQNVSLNLKLRYLGLVLTIDR
jgi:hypothetical protein